MAQNLIVAMVRGYQCWGVPSIGVLPNPTVFWEDSSSPLSLVKNITTVILAVVSDMIMVCLGEQSIPFHRPFRIRMK